MQLLRAPCEDRARPSACSAGPRAKKPPRELPTPLPHKIFPTFFPHLPSPSFCLALRFSVTTYFYQCQFYAIFQLVFSSFLLMMLPSRIILAFCPWVLPPRTLAPMQVSVSCPVKTQICMGFLVSFCCFGFYKNITVCFSMKHQFWKLWEGSHEGGIIQLHSRVYESTKS